jgi:hypothetical protein
MDRLVDSAGAKSRMRFARLLGGGGMEGKPNQKILLVLFSDFKF